jgi:hypothetical protein
MPCALHEVEATQIIASCPPLKVSPVTSSFPQIEEVHINPVGQFSSKKTQCFTGPIP